MLNKKLNTKESTLTSFFVDLLNNETQENFEFVIFEVNRCALDLAPEFKKVNETCLLTELISSISAKIGKPILKHKPPIWLVKKYSFSAMITCFSHLPKNITQFLKNIGLLIALTHEDISQLNLYFKLLRLLMEKGALKNFAELEYYINSKDIYSRKNIKALIDSLKDSPEKRILEMTVDYLRDELNTNLATLLRTIDTSEEDLASIKTAENGKSKYWINRISMINKNSLSLFTDNERRAISENLEHLGRSKPLIRELLTLSYLLIPVKYLLQMSLVESKDGTFLKVPYISPEDAAKPLNSTVFCNSDNYYYLKLDHLFENIIRHFSVRKESDNNTLGSVLNISVSELEMELSTFLSNIRRKFSRVIQLRFEYESARRSWINTKKIALVYAIHGGNRWHPATENYYIQFDSRVVIRQLNNNAKSLFLSLQFEENAKPTIIGCNNNIELQYLSKLAIRKRREVYKMLNSANSIKQLTDAFNQYALYLGFWLFLISARYKNKLFESRMQFIPEMNLLFVVDKLTFHWPSERPLALPPELTKQMLDYEKIRDLIISKFENKKTIPLIFKIEDGCIKTIGVEEIAIFLGESPKFVTKLRPTIRTWFETLNCSQEAIQIQFGHGNGYQNPFGNNAHSSFLTWTKELSKLLGNYQKQLKIKTFQVKNVTKFESLACDKCSHRAKYVDVKQEDVRQIELVKEQANTLGIFDGLVKTIEDRERLEFALRDEFVNEILLNKIIDRFFNWMRQDGYKIGFSMARFRLKEKSHFSKNFCFRLKQGILIENAIKNISRVKLNKQEVRAFDLLCEIFFKFKQAKNFVHLDEQITSTALFTFLDKNGLSFIGKKETLFRIAETLAMTILPGSIYQMRKGCELEYEGSPLNKDLIAKKRPKLQVVTDTSNTNKPLNRYRSARKVKRKIVLFIKSHDDTPKGRKNLILDMRILLNDHDFDKLAESFLEWAIAVVEFGGKKKKHLTWSTLLEYFSIAKHLDIIFLKQELAKLSLRNANLLIDTYLLNEHDSVGDSLHGRFYEWLEFTYGVLAPRNSNPLQKNIADNLNIILEIEYKYLVKLYWENYKTTQDRFLLAKAFALTVGFLISGRRSEVRSLLPQDIQVGLNGKYTIIVRKSKSDAGRRIIVVSDLSDAERGIIMETLKMCPLMGRMPILSIACQSIKKVNDVFSSLTKDLKLVTGDNRFRYHDIGRSTINKCLERIFAPSYRLFDVNTINVPALRHRHISTSLSRYGVLKKRFIQDHHFTSIGDWSNEEIVKFLSLKPDNVRQLKSRRGLPSKPSSIAKIVNEKPPKLGDNFGFNHLKLAQARNTAPGFYEFVCSALASVKYLNDLIEQLKANHPLTGMFVEKNFRLNSPKTLSSSEISKLLSFSKTVKVINIEKQETSKFTKILTSIFLCRAKDLRSSYTNLNDTKSLTELLSLFGLSNEITINEFEGMSSLEFHLGGHILTYPKNTWIYLELVYLFFISGDLSCKP